MKLEDYGIDQNTGFFISEPTESILAPEWQQVLDSLPDLVAAGNVREKIAELSSIPPLAEDVREFDNFDPLVLNAQRDLAWVAQAWVRGEQPPSPTLPEFIAKPLDELSKTTGVPAITTYADVVLRNGTIRDGANPESVLPTDFTEKYGYTGRGGQEAWFFKVHMAIETAFGPALKAMVDIVNKIDDQEISDSDRTVAIEADLRKIEDVMNYVNKTVMATMYDELDPKFFFGTMRSYVAGTGDLQSEPDGPKGLVFEGVDDPSPRVMNGGSGAQTVFPVAFDAILGIEHEGAMASGFLADTAKYIIEPWKKFAEDLGQYSDKLRDIAKEEPRVKEALDEAINGMVVFRAKHVHMAKSYISKPAGHITDKKGVAANLRAGQEGTGGSPFLALLEEMKRNTAEARMGVPALEVIKMFSVLDEGSASRWHRFEEDIIDAGIKLENIVNEPNKWPEQTNGARELQTPLGYVENQISTAYKSGHPTADLEEIRDRLVELGARRSSEKALSPEAQSLSEQDILLLELFDVVSEGRTKRWDRYERSAERRGIDIGEIINQPVTEAMSTISPELEVGMTVLELAFMQLEEAVEREQRGITGIAESLIGVLAEKGARVPENSRYHGISNVLKGPEEGQKR